MWVYTVCSGLAIPILSVIIKVSSSATDHISKTLIRERSCYISFFYDIYSQHRVKKTSTGHIMRTVLAEIILQIRTVCSLNGMQMFIKQLQHLEVYMHERPSTLNNEAYSSLLHLYIVDSCLLSWFQWFPRWFRWFLNQTPLYIDDFTNFYNLSLSSTVILVTTLPIYL